MEPEGHEQCNLRKIRASEMTAEGLRAHGTMAIGRDISRGLTRATIPAVALLLTIPLAGCGSTVADLPAPIGIAQGLPARPAVLPATPAVHDMPPARDLKLLTKEEQKTLEGDLATQLERQNKRAGISPAKTPKADPKRAKKSEKKPPSD